MPTKKEAKEAVKDEKGKKKKNVFSAGTAADIFNKKKKKRADIMKELFGEE